MTFSQIKLISGCVVLYLQSDLLTQYTVFLEEEVKCTLFCLCSMQEGYLALTWCKLTSSSSNDKITETGFIGTLISPFMKEIVCGFKKELIKYNWLPSLTFRIFHLVS